jgi:hypothetical protein
MAFVLFGVLALLAAMGFNFVHNKVWTNARFTSQQAKYTGKTLYAFNTVATAAVIFVTIIVAGFLLKEAGQRVEIPGA